MTRTMCNHPLSLSDHRPQHPTFTNPDVIDANLIPTTSVDQFVAAIGSWFGITDPDPAANVPDPKNFATPRLGFIRS